MSDPVRGYDNGYAHGYTDGWDACANVIAQQQKARLSKKAQRTSRLAVARNADSIKGVQLDVLTALRKAPLGLTDFDLESALGRSHQSVSAARNALMNAGLVTDSGKTRPNARGNQSIVWLVSSPASQETDDSARSTHSSPTSPYFDLPPTAVHQRDWHADQQRLDGERS